MPVIERVTGEEAVSRVEGALDELATDVKVNRGHVDLTCRPENLVEALTRLRDSEGIMCRFFTFLSGVDRSEFGSAADGDGPDQGEGEGGETGGSRSGPELEVLIHVYSPSTAIHVTVHVPVDGDKPSCPTISGVYRGAFWQERETHEMFGIDFEGHPHLINLYLPEDFDGHPLLKTFRLPARMLKPWPGAKDAEEAASGGRA